MAKHQSATVRLATAPDGNPGFQAVDPSEADPENTMELWAYVLTSPHAHAFVEIPQGCSMVMLCDDNVPALLDIDPGQYEMSAEALEGRSLPFALVVMPDHHARQTLRWSADQTRAALQQLVAAGPSAGQG